MTSAATNSVGNQATMEASGKAKSGAITPMISRGPRANSWTCPSTDGSPANHPCQSSQLMSTTASASPGPGRRPTWGRTLSVRKKSRVTSTWGRRSTRSSTRTLPVKVSKPARSDSVRACSP